MFSSEAWLANPSSGFYNGIATQSLRFEDGDSPVLTRTPSSDGNKRTWTWSCWFKMANIIDTSGNVESTLMSVDNSNSGKYTILGWYQDSLYAQLAGSGQVTAQYGGPAKVRDTTGWYHVVWAVDTTQSTSGNRSKVYLNGTQLSFTTDNAFPQNTDTDVNDTNYAMEIGDTTDYARHFDGYMAEINFIDGLQLAPTSFGETKEGAWIPKDTSGLTFGTNGFRLQFKQTGTGTASTSTIGADTANSNHFTSSNLASTDSNIPDSPENNFATLNPLKTNRLTETYSEGNLRYASSQTSTNPATTSTMAVSSGKWYWEVFIKAQGNTVNSVGIIDVEYGMENDSSAGYSSSSGVYSYQAAGTERSANGNHTYGDSWTDDDLIGVALDMDNGNVYLYKNGVIQNSGTALQGSLTTTGSGTYSAYSLVYNNGDQIYNFGQDGTFNAEKTAQGNTDGNGVGNFFYSVPSGYLALCTSNFSEPTLGPNSDEQPDDHFETFIYSGDANATRTISGFNFQADLMWNKARNQAFGHKLYDSTRGNDKAVSTSSNAAESTHDVFNGFTSDGFNTTTDGSAGDLLNYDGGTYVNFLWKANGGTTTTNDASATGVGTIDSVYQANTTAGFSIVTWTGTGSEGTIAHGLGAVPKWVIIKNRTDAREFTSGHVSNGYAGQQYLTTNGAYSGNDGSFGSTSPTSAVVNVNSDQTVNESSDNMLMYCWAEVAGYSKFGKFIGTGNGNGNYVHVGFRPELVIIKQASAAGDWNMIDPIRQTHNGVNGLPVVRANSSAVEELASGNQGQIDFLSNGFKLRSAHSSFNTAGATIIYMAWADMPEKYSNAF